MSFELSLSDVEKCVLEDGTTIMTSVTNSGYLLYTMNMLKSLSRFGLDRKMLIVCIDKKAHNVLAGLGYNTFCIDDKELGKFCPWNTKGYDKICYLKLVLIYRILTLNKNVLLVDGDIVFLRNPLEDIFKWTHSTSIDVFVQNDAQDNLNITNMCTGYMYIKANERLIKLYDCVSELGQKRYMTCAFDNNDQTYFNNFVKPNCKMEPLMLEAYPNGKYFYENAPTLLGTAILVHFNWVHGHLKMAKMKEYKMWLLTPEEEEVV
jgi:hypothetical protein